MEVWLWVLILILGICVAGLLVKVHLLRKSAREIEEAFADRLAADTNTLIDISSRDRCMRRLAEAVNVQLRNLRKERIRFQQGDMELKNAVTNISHDLRTPLTAISGYLELMKQEEKTKEAERYLDIIEERTNVMRELAEELFRYSVISSTAKEIFREEVVLNRMLEESLSAYYVVLKRAGIQPEVLMPEKRVKRNLDKHALSRIIGNVLSNAVKYSDGDLQIVLKEDGTMIFSNTASGLNEVETGKLFDRFYTVEDAKKSTGLGLSIAKILTEQMGGTITAKYKESRISIYIEFKDS